MAEGTLGSKPLSTPSRLGRPRPKERHAGFCAHTHGRRPSVSHAGDRLAARAGGAGPPGQRLVPFVTNSSKSVMRVPAVMWHDAGVPANFMNCPIFFYYSGLRRITIGDSYQTQRPRTRVALMRRNVAMRQVRERDVPHDCDTQRAHA